MRAVLGVILVPLLVLAGCGEPTTGGSATDPTTGSSGPSASETVPDNGPVRHDLVAVVSGSAAGGPNVSAEPTVLGSDAAVRTFAYRFRGSLADDIVSAADRASAAGDQTLVAAVVDIGCEPPTQIHVRMVFGRLSITATPVVSRRECFAPVTSVALVVVPTAATGSLTGAS